jgi:hypothetical protein
MGFTPEDIAEVTDRLVDELVIWGDADTISTRIREHLQAGAHHIMLHVLSEGGQPGPGGVTLPAEPVLGVTAGHQCHLREPQ